MIKIDYSLEVEQAIKNNDPLVALESTIITHGMPWPENLNTAKDVEAIVRDNGATPATIAIINGVIKVGLDDEPLKDVEKSVYIPMKGYNKSMNVSHALTIVLGEWMRQNYYP